MRLSALKVFLDWDHRLWGSLEPRAQQIYDPGAQSWVKSMFHKDFWEAANTVFKVLSNIVEEMLTDNCDTHADEYAQAVWSISAFMPGLETQSNKCSARGGGRKSC